MSILPVKIDESRGGSFNLVEIWAFEIDSSTERQLSLRRMWPLARDNVLGLELDMLIIVLYWFPSTKFQVLELAFTSTFCDTDMMKDVGGRLSPSQL
jgi:hypothetical protein